MSKTKRKTEETCNKRQLALNIALEAGALTRCKRHPECVFEGDKPDATAYQLAQRRFVKDGLSEIFRDEQELIDLIRQIIDENPGEECSRCLALEMLD